MTRQRHLSLAGEDSEVCGYYFVDISVEWSPGVSVGALQNHPEIDTPSSTGQYRELDYHLRTLFLALT